MKKQDNRIGESNYTKYGTEMIIVEYNNYHDITVEFQDKYKIRKKCQYKEFKSGKVKNPYDKSVCNVGYIGEGSFAISIDSKATKAYEVWRSMIMRCYDKKTQEREPTYKNCSVDKSWLCFQIFAEWFYDNYYELETEKTHLDKDILFPNNKIYGPNTCLFVPQTINSMFINKSINKNRELPKGISFVNNKYLTRGTKDGKMVHIGYFDSLNEALYAYNQYEQNKLNNIINEYKDVIPQKVIDAIYKYID